MVISGPKTIFCLKQITGGTTAKKKKKWDAFITFYEFFSDILAHTYSSSSVKFLEALLINVISVNLGGLEQLILPY